MKKYMMIWICICICMLPLQVWAITNLKANGQTEVTVNAVPVVLQVSAELSRVGAVLEGGIYADVNENGVFDPVDYAWNWRYGYIIDGVGWIMDPTQPLASILGDDGPADGKLNIIFPLLHQQVKNWPNGTVFIFLKDEDGSWGQIKLHFHIQAKAPAIVGKITDAATGAPVADLAITAGKQSGTFDFEYATGRTDAQGNYMVLVSSGTWDLYIDGAGEGTGAYKPSQATGIKVAEDQIVTKNFALAGYSALITGSVLYEDGTPAQRVFLFAPGGSYTVAKSDSSGRFLMGVDPGYVEVGLTHNFLANYVHLSQYYEVPLWQRKTVPSGTTQFDFLLKKHTAFIKGRCTLDGRGVMGVQVTADYRDPALGSNRSSNALSDLNGDYLIGVMPGTVSRLEVFVPGLETVNSTGTLTNLVVPAGDTLKGIDFQYKLEQGANGIKGRVIGPAGTPAPGIYVVAVEEQTLFYDSYLFQYTNAGGEFDFPGLKDGKWRIGVFKFGAFSTPDMAYFELNGGNKVTGVEFALTGFTGIAAAEGHGPASFMLEQNFPNPFNAETTINLTLAGPGRVKVAIYDAVGHLVRQIEHSASNAGTQQIRWDGRDDLGRPLASGLYLYAVKSRGSSQMRKMLLIR